MSEMEDLSAFAVLVEEGSFTSAALRLECSKGRLSKRISQLEKTYAVQLLYRTTRNLSLTPAGVALLPQAQQLLVHMERARRIVALMRDDMIGEVRITAPISLGQTFFDGLLMEFCEAYPQVKIELNLDNGVRDLRREGFDIGIRSNVQSDERLVARPLLAMQELTCASTAYLDRHGWPLAPQELVNHQCLTNSHHNGTRDQWLYHQNHELIRVQVNGPFATNQYNLLKKAALAGAGIARVPSYMVHEEFAAGQLHWLFREYQTAITPMFLVHPYEGEVPRRVQVLADYLVGWFERSCSALERTV
ncbi:LysR family transcriptional regulator [Pseudomonas sp. CDFA 602]|uniref:LysR family transcriptional regulator n=1 Tax=Pseudomonas californiensis TaxID=2829823 RepID=UPI001E6411FA|nr:LysR family transcriptional regulator [Pseudomonas californiensis]MCD5995860.1 LysR family transcriptional regulator [Pseudomonas californiensis]MCD6001504.1 LysR family transcriptional regulator [Pseudomonas californiensis]